MPERIVIKGRPEELEKAATEEAIERGEARSVVEEVEGRRVLRIRWITGKTSAGRLFGRYGKEGRPDFFRLLFGAIAGSLREQFGEEGEELFNKLRESREFKQSVSKLFEEMKNWFFNEIVPKYGIEPGDIFVITAEIEVDLETGRITWNKEKTSVIYWVRSDKLPEKCREIMGTVSGSEEVEKLRKMLEEKDKEIERLKKEIEELKRKLREREEELEEAEEEEIEEEEEEEEE
ncbi:MAG: transcription factor [Crenarchaeota archaeon]|nr:transcription factor [Thermoproteota archaeon]